MVSFNRRLGVLYFGESLSPEPVNDVFVVEDEDLIVLERQCRELDAPGGDVDRLDGQDGGREPQLPQLLALGGEADEGVVHRGHGDRLLTPEKTNGL